MANLLDKYLRCYPLQCAECLSLTGMFLERSKQVFILQQRKFPIEALTAEQVSQNQRSREVLTKRHESARQGREGHTGRKG